MEAYPEEKSIVSDDGEESKRAISPSLQHSELVRRISMLHSGSTDSLGKLAETRRQSLSESLKVVVNAHSHSHSEKQLNHEVKSVNKRLINRFSLTFTVPELEALFNEHHQHTFFWHVRNIMLLGLVK